AVGQAGCGSCTPLPVVVHDVGTGAIIARTDPAADEADVAPTLSPDGTQVAYGRVRLEAGGSGIWTMRVGGGAPVQLTTAGSCPNWSPDGKTIAYLASNDFPSALRLVSPQGGTARSILSRTVTCELGSPSWSPNSRRIAVVLASEHLGVVDVATGRVRVVPKLLVGGDDSFSWSPNSSTLLVAASTKVHGCSSLWKVTARTGTARIFRRC